MYYTECLTTSGFWNKQGNVKNVRFRNILNTKIYKFKQATKWERETSIKEQHIARYSDLVLLQNVVELVFWIWKLPSCLKICQVKQSIQRVKFWHCSIGGKIPLFKTHQDKRNVFIFQTTRERYIYLQVYSETGDHFQFVINKILCFLKRIV